MNPGSTNLRRVLGAALVALCAGVAVVAISQGFSDDFIVRLLQGVAIFAAAPPRSRW